MRRVELDGDASQPWDRRLAPEQHLTAAEVCGVNDGTVLADGTVVLVTNAGGILTSHDGGQSFSLRFLPDRDSISAVLPRDAGGILVAGQGGLRVIEDVK